MRLQSRHGLKMNIKRPTIALLPYISIRFPVQYKWPDLFLFSLKLELNGILKSFCCPHLTYTKSSCAFSKALFINFRTLECSFSAFHFHEIRWKCKSTQFYFVTSQRIVYTNFAPANQSELFGLNNRFIQSHCTMLDSKNNAWDGNFCSNVRVGCSMVSVSSKF